MGKAKEVTDYQYNVDFKVVKKDNTYFLEFRDKTLRNATRAEIALYHQIQRLMNTIDHATSRLVGKGTDGLPKNVNGLPPGVVRRKDMDAEQLTQQRYDEELHNKDQLQKETDDAHKAFDAECKTALNNCMYPFVPPNMTILEFENMTVKMFDILRDIWDKELYGE